MTISLLFFSFYNIFIFVCCFLFIDTLCETSKSLASQIVSASEASWCCTHLINPSFVDELLTSQLYLKKQKQQPVRLWVKLEMHLLLTALVCHAKCCTFGYFAHQMCELFNSNT